MSDAADWMIAVIREWREALPAFDAEGWEYKFPRSVHYRRPRRRRREAPVKVERPLFFNYCAIRGDVRDVLASEYVVRLFVKDEEVVMLREAELAGMLIGQAEVREGQEIEVIEGQWSGCVGIVRGGRILLRELMFGREVWLGVDEVVVIDRAGT